LIVYFSRVGNTDLSGDVDAISSASINLRNGEYVGNTELIARWIQDEVGGDMFLIQTEKPYPLNYDETVKRGEGENEDSVHPPLASNVENLDDYDTVFLGYPVWAYDIPMPVYSFLDEHDLSGKTVVPFGSSGATSISRVAEAISEIYPDATVLEGITVNHNQVLDAQPAIVEWLTKLGFIS
jgi:flavodoxin